MLISSTLALSAPNAQYANKFAYIAVPTSFQRKSEHLRYHSGALAKDGLSLACDFVAIFSRKA